MSKSTSRRTPIPRATQNAVLLKSARRCCLCFGFYSDHSPKRGQLAHLDRNCANPLEDNLAWLCLSHHDEYDSRPSQSKGLTIGEVKEYRELLYRHIDVLRVLVDAGDDVHVHSTAHASASTPASASSNVEDDDLLMLKWAMAISTPVSMQPASCAFVGAVVVNDGCVVGHGSHLTEHFCHAEAQALQRAGSGARGATLYTTLEPCSDELIHALKRTGQSCAALIAASGIRRVVIGMPDPNPLVTGHGRRQLRAHGIEVVEDTRLQDILAVNDRYIKFMDGGGLTPFSASGAHQQAALKLPSVLTDLIRTVVFKFKNPSGPGFRYNPTKDEKSGLTTTAGLTFALNCAGVPFAHPIMRENLAWLRAAIMDEGVAIRDSSRRHVTDTLAFSILTMARAVKECNDPTIRRDLASACNTLLVGRARDGAGWDYYLEDQETRVPSTALALWALSEAMPMLPLGRRTHPAVAAVDNAGSCLLSAGRHHMWNWGFELGGTECNVSATALATLGIVSTNILLSPQQAQSIIHNIGRALPQDASWHDPEERIDESTTVIRMAIPYALMALKQLGEPIYRARQGDSDYIDRGLAWMIAHYSGEYLRKEMTSRGDDPFPYRDSLIGMGMLHRGITLQEVVRLMGMVQDATIHEMRQG